jgi:hypothetical protein
VSLSIGCQRNTSYPASDGHNPDDVTSHSIMFVLIQWDFSWPTHLRWASFQHLIEHITLVPYNAGYFSWSVAFPSYLSSQNLISDPFLMENTHMWRRTSSLP